MSPFVKYNDRLWICEWMNEWQAAMLFVEFVYARAGRADSGASGAALVASKIATHQHGVRSSTPRAATPKYWNFGSILFLILV